MKKYSCIAIVLLIGSLCMTVTNSMHDFYRFETPVLELVDSTTTATIYHAIPKECDGDCVHPANYKFCIDLKQPQAHRIIAMERTMLKKYGLHYGDLVYIKGTDYDGYWQIQDTMNKRYAGQSRIDLLVANSIKYGKWKNVKVYKVTGSEQLIQKIYSEHMLASL